MPACRSAASSRVGRLFKRLVHAELSACPSRTARPFAQRTERSHATRLHSRRLSAEQSRNVSGRQFDPTFRLGSPSLGTIEIDTKAPPNSRSRQLHGAPLVVHPRWREFRFPVELLGACVSQLSTSFETQRPGLVAKLSTLAWICSMDMRPGITNTTSFECYCSFCRALFMIGLYGHL